MPKADSFLIRIKYLRFSYGRNLILKGLDLEVPRGKVVAILGASGCGKSTLLRLIGGQLKPRGGFVEVEGRVVRDMREIGRASCRERVSRCV